MYKNYKIQIMNTSRINLFFIFAQNFKIITLIYSYIFFINIKSTLWQYQNLSISG